MSSSTEIWRHLPLLFQRSCRVPFGRTCTVIERLKNDSSCTTLRLVGVEGTVCMEALSEALQNNTTLQHVSIGGSFLPSIHKDEVEELFRAIGSLVNLRKLTLEGTEDSEGFPVKSLTLLVETNNKGGGGLEEISCRYIDLLVPTPEFMADLGRALKNCKSLHTVIWSSVDLLLTSTPYTTTTTIRLLDPILAALSHCQDVQVGLRHRRDHCCHVSPQALQSLLSGRLQKLTLKRRIALDSSHLCTILESCSGLSELQLDQVHLLMDSSDTLWKDLASMIQTNTTLQILDLNFAYDTKDCCMDHEQVLAITEALKGKTSLKNLSLLGAMKKCDAKSWRDLLENHNYTLEELELSNLDDEKLQFLLQLNRQPVEGSSQRLRTTILRDAIPRQLIQPCVEAALQLGSEDDNPFDDEDDLLWELPNNTRGLSGLFYLLQQQPALVRTLQQYMTAWEEAMRKVKDDESKKAYIPLGGASPQLLLLDDDIVALW